MPPRVGGRTFPATITAVALVAMAVAAAVAASTFVQWQKLGASQAALVSPRVASGSAWEVGFTRPIGLDTRPRGPGEVEERLVLLMGSATRTVDVAAYTFDLQSVAEAMAAAAARGVRVRMVTDTDSLEKTLDSRSQDAFRTVRRAGIEIVADFRPAIMHHKFTVVDSEWVQTGSWNYTENDTHRLDNNSVVFRSAELASSYTAEFERMFSQRRFGPTKTPRSGAGPTLTVGGLRIESYFAPQDGIATRLMERVNATQSRLHFLAFSFTHDALGEAIIARARAGVEVQGVFEANGSESVFSELRRMKQAGLDVYTDANPSYMHHKVLLLDDRTTIFGSYNFSSSAERANDENLLVVEDPQFTALFEQEFQRILALARRPIAWPR